MSYYLCKYNGGNITPLDGPMRSRTVVNMIHSLGDLSRQKVGYCNASRYELAKRKLYPRTKAGDAKLLIDMAANRLESAHQTYQFFYIKDKLYYPVFIDADGDQIEEVQDDEYGSLCESCVTWGLMHFAQQQKKGKYDDIEGLHHIQLWQESSPEHCDFVSCGHCGEYIDVSVLHTFSQEIDHWTDIVTDEDFKRQVDFPRDAWVMRELLISSDAYQNHPAELLKLANRVLDNKPYKAC
ncbi:MULTISPECIES: hypothetical protein [unclassified Spirosoma]|uniref:hypothetical protein n=1 Tax=unclassified Spirosoma TaxID=2621999 RepID=UPI000966C853|nr:MULTISPECIES: hypothetical protein [unclassified Spirosoma]MBN8824414.1 hypothetical protein [Spirosoma sp.]OJW70123.1 MAG: hypothetical protein BGO59_25965 [Spirosoma sp. 48-14]